MPVPAVLFFLLLSALLFYKKSKALAYSVLTLALLSLYLLSLKPVANAITSPLEFHHPKYSGQAVSYVVVLGSGHSSDERIPVLSQISRTGLSRLMAGIQVYRQNPGAKLLLSGYGGYDPRSHAEVAADIAQLLGVDPQDIMLAPDARDTREEAQTWSSLLKPESFALVTSALHMKRAMAIFEQEGLSPIAAPANYETAGERQTYWMDWLPRARHLELSEAAWHEHLGIAWAQLKLLAK